MDNKEIHHNNNEKSSLFTEENSENNQNVMEINRYLKNENSNILISNKSLVNNIINDGKVILSENSFFNDLDNIMNNNEFRNFYDKYFNDFTDTKVVLLYMKLYETLQIEYREKNGCDVEKEVLAYIMKELMIDNISRKNIFDAFNDYTENKNKNGNKKYLLDIFENKNKKNMIK